MKCHLDYCRLQWVTREFFPLKYAFRNDFIESRFCAIFPSIFSQGKVKEEVLFLPLCDAIDKEENAKEQDSGGSNNSQAILTTTIPINRYLTKIVQIPKIISQEDTRTTLMIKNIPNKFTKSFFLDLFMKDFKGKYDLFLLPMDMKEKKNVGYGFINFVDSFHIIHFYELFNGKKWPNTNSMKICEIVYSKMQGLKKLLKHYPLKSLQANDNDEKEKQEFPNYVQPQVRIILPKAYMKEFRTKYPKAPFILSSEYIIVLSDHISLSLRKEF